IPGFSSVLKKTKANPFMNNYESKIASALPLSRAQVMGTISLLEGGATIPFIARYRKEVTNGLDEVQIADIRDLLKRLQELEKRKDTVFKSIEEQGKLTPELIKQINDAETISALEDIYLPYKPKKRTRASIAREKDLQPLADKLLLQEAFDVKSFAESFVDSKKGVESLEDALAGARDILAELFSESATVRAKIRKLFGESGSFKSTLIAEQEEAAQKYKDYFDWKEPVKSI